MTDQLSSISVDELCHAKPPHEYMKYHPQDNCAVCYWEDLKEALIKKHPDWSDDQIGKWIDNYGESRCAENGCLKKANEANGELSMFCNQHTEKYIYEGDDTS